MPLFCGYGHFVKLNGRLNGPRDKTLAPQISHAAILQQYDKLDTEFGLTLRKLRSTEEKLKTANGYARTLEQRIASLELAKEKKKVELLLALRQERDLHFETLLRDRQKSRFWHRFTKGWTEATALNSVAAINRVLGQVTSGQLKFTSQIRKVSLSDQDTYHAVRTQAALSRAEDGTEILQAQETEEHGIHSVVIKLPESSTNFIVSGRVNINLDQCEEAHVCLRSTVDRTNAILAHVKASGRPRARLEAAPKQGVAHASVRKLAQNWFEVHIEGVLFADGAQAEIEISMVQNGLRKFAGSPDRKFSVRRVSYAFTTWLDRLEEKPSPSPRPPAPAENEEFDKLKRIRKDAQKRQSLRRAFIASPEYKHIVSQRGRYKGRRAFIIGNGPSIKDQDLVPLKDEITFVTNWFVNHPEFRQINPSYICVSSHEMFGGWNTPEPQLNLDWYTKLTALGGEVRKVFSHRFAPYIKEKGLFDPGEVDYLLFDRPKEQVDIAQDINVDVSRPMLDGYTGVITFCLPLAHHLGISEIYLLGCDCDYGLKTETDERQYFYDRAQHTSTETKSSSLLRVWADDGPGFEAYEMVKTRFDADGIPIVNLTAGGRLNIFPRANYERTMAGLQVAS